jgi:hypothetical protein
MPVFTEGKGVPFPRWQIEEDPSLMLMQIDAPTDAEHPDVLRYAYMLSEALFKQGRREPNWWKYPRGTRRFNKIYGTKFSSKAPRGVVTGMPRRTAQPRRSHATKRDSDSGVPSALTLWEGSHSKAGSTPWQGTDYNERSINGVRNGLVGIYLDGVQGVSPERAGFGWKQIPVDKADVWLARARDVLGKLEAQKAPRQVKAWQARHVKDLRGLIEKAQAVRDGAPQKMTAADYSALRAWRGAP